MINSTKPLTILDYIIIVSLFLFSVNTAIYKLGDTPMWDDEAMVSWMSENLSINNNYKAFDGTNAFLYRNGSLIDSNLMYKNLPLDIYYLSIFKKIQKLNDYTERLPFVLAGILGLLCSFFSIRIIVKNKIWLLFSFGLLSTSIQFLLSNRNCRYYSLEFLLGNLLFLSSYYSIFSKNKFLKISYSILYIITGYLMFIGHFSQCISWIIFILSYFYFTKLIDFKNYKKHYLYFFSNLILFILQLRFILIEKPWTRTDLINSDSLIVKYLKLSSWLINDLNRINVIPFIAIIGIIYIYFFYKNTSENFKVILKSSLIFFGVSIIMSPQATSQSVCFDIRYIYIGFIPLYIIMGYMFKIVFEKKQFYSFICILVFVIFQSTNLFSYFPDGNPPRTLLYGFYDGLNNNYTTSFKEVKSYLEAQKLTNKFSISCFPKYYNTCIMKYFRNKAIITHELDSNSILFKNGIVKKYNLEHSLWNYENPDFVVVFGNNTELASQSGINLNEYKEIDTLKVFGNSFDISRPELYWHSFYPRTIFSLNQDAVYIYRK